MDFFLLIATNHRWFTMINARWAAKPLTCSEVDRLHL